MSQVFHRPRTERHPETEEQPDTRPARRRDQPERRRSVGNAVENLCATRADSSGGWRTIAARPQERPRGTRTRRPPRGRPRHRTRCGSRVGYARVSTRQQDLTLQLDALSGPAARGSSVTSAPARSASVPISRPAWTTCAPATPSSCGGSIASAAASATWSTSLRCSSSDTSRFDRCESRSTRRLRTGKLQLHLFAALAEFERELIRERSQAGREVAKAAGRLGGRPLKLTPEKKAAALAMRTRGDMTMSQIAAHST
jgi:hypothetical protein